MWPRIYFTMYRYIQDNHNKKNMIQGIQQANIYLVKNKTCSQAISRRYLGWKKTNI